MYPKIKTAWKLTNYLLYCLLGRAFPSTIMPYSYLLRDLRNFWATQSIQECGSCFKVDRGVYLSPNIKVGERVTINEGARVRGNVSLGDDVLIAPGVQLITSTHIFDSLEVPINLQGSLNKGIVVGNDVWLGTNVIILPGVVIGDCSIVGAGSIVTKNIPPYSVCVGVPAKIVKKRNHE